MRNTVPPGSTVATGRMPPSSVPELSVGNEPVDQTTQLSWFGRRDITFLQISSIEMTARPLSSCPVTTRLILSAIFYFSNPMLVLFLPTLPTCASARDFRHLHYQTAPDEWPNAVEETSKREQQ